MSTDKIIPANDDDNTVDLLIRALRVTTDLVTRSHIELGLLNEGRRIAASLPPEIITEARPAERPAARVPTKRSR